MAKEETKVEEKETKVKEPKKKKNLEEELLEYKQKYLYTLAELSNLGKQHEKEKKDLAKYFTQDFLLELLPLYDIFTMVISNKNVTPEVAAYLKGFELVYAQFEQFLDRNGVSEIVTKLGEEYDPLLHNAIEIEEIEEGEQHKIVQIYQKGYKMHDRVLRPTSVKITKLKTNEEPKEEN